MGFLDRLLGREQAPGHPASPRRNAGGTELSPDEAAIERYRYMLRTAPPDRIEEAHAEAFAKLTPEQRTQVLEGLSAEVPPGERAASDDPRSLARMATRAEMRQPGTLERSFGRTGGRGGGIGMGGLIAGSLLASVAGAFIGTAVADAMFDMSDSGDSADTADGGGDASADGGDAGDAGGGDFGDFGGGDFGGGDFGGFSTRLP